MYVCICNNVTESDIEDAVRKGAQSVACLTEDLGVAGCCGQCYYVAEQTLQSALDCITPFPGLTNKSLATHAG